MSDATSENTVAMGGSSSSCMNCGANYLGGSKCTCCGNELLYVAACTYRNGSEVAAAEGFAERNGLTGGFIGYTSGCIGDTIKKSPF